jgi:hypothetical protein
MKAELYAVIGRQHPVAISKSKMPAEVRVSLFEMPVLLAIMIPTGYHSKKQFK